MLLNLHVYGYMLSEMVSNRPSTCSYICVCSSSILSEPLSNDLVQLITGFETFLKSQKTESDLISKYSDTSMQKVLQDTATQSQVQHKELVMM